MRAMEKRVVDAMGLEAAKACGQRKPSEILEGAPARATTMAK